MKSVSKTYTCKKMGGITLSGLVAAALALAATSLQAADDIYVSDLYGSSGVSEYTLSGHRVTKPLVPGSELSDPFGMAISGNTLYVANMGSDTISTYDASTGASIDPSFISGVGLNQPASLLLSGDTLFVASIGGSGPSDAYHGAIYEFNATTGAMLGTGPLTTGLDYSEYMALSGNDLYVSTWNSVTKIDATTGAIIGGGPLLQTDNARGVAVHGNHLYVVDSVDGTVSEYNATTGKEIGSPLITGLDDPRQIAYFDGHLYVSDVGTNTIAEYNAKTGCEIGTVVSCADNPYDFIITDPTHSAAAVPEPSTWAMLLAGGLILFARLRRRSARSVGTN
jgi:DNA-binding beta-propeller fold protein YncE